MQLTIKLLIKCNYNQSNHKNTIYALTVDKSLFSISSSFKWKVRLNWTESRKIKINIMADVGKKPAETKKFGPVCFNLKEVRKMNTL